MAQRIIPMMADEDAGAAADWPCEACCFTERTDERYTDDEGVVGHAELELGGEIVMLATPNRDYQSPARHRESCDAARRWLDNPWVIDGVFVQVDDIDAHHTHAVASGATVIRPPEEPGVGFRIYTVEDLEGHRWMFGQSV
jgi:uncharacterized glyoxalase superfamily protein PhnB